MRTQRINKTYTANLDQVTDLLKGPKARKVITNAGELIAARARTMAPVQTGAYRASIRVVIDEHPSRIAAHIGPHIWYGNIVEAHAHVMRRALG